MQKYKTDGSVADYGTAESGKFLSKVEASEHRRRLKIEPNDLESRLLLFGRGFFGKSGDYTPHLIWLVDKHPRNWLHSIITAHNDNDAYHAVRAKWLEQVRLNKDDVTILAHAARYFWALDAKTAVKLLERASDIAKTDEQISFQLLEVYRTYWSDSPRAVQRFASKATEQMKIAIAHYSSPNEEDSDSVQYFSRQYSTLLTMLCITVWCQMLKIWETPC